MDFDQLCNTLKERLASELQEVNDPGRRQDLLIDALYELSRSILPLLGVPKKSREYQEKQATLLDLISFLVIPLIKGAEDRRGVAVLSEIGEGCQDPLLRKKFQVYAQELLAKIETRRNPASVADMRKLGCGIAASAAAALALYLLWPAAEPNPVSVPHSVVASPQADQVAPSTTYQATAKTQPLPAISLPPLIGDDHAAPERATPEPARAAAQGEQITRVRIINNQVLVPVTLKNGTETVKLELVLDTGATRTAIHEYLAVKLRIDLRTARLSQAEVADGRLISSRVAKIDAINVGPFSMAAADVELIPYRGADGMHDGLLGMDFLARHRYQIDMERELIRWF